MPTKAFILIETAIGKTRDVIATLRTISEVVAVDAVTGPFDVIVTVQAADLSSIGDVVTGRIHATNGIVRTVTCLNISAPS